MLKKTNNFVYAYKFKIPVKYNENYFMENFSERDLTKNMYKPKDSNHFGSLIFIKEDEGILFFKFSKIKDKGILITDLKSKIQRLLGIKKEYKYTTNSLFAYCPEKNILLGLYNDEAMKHIVAPLRRYFKEFLGETSIESEIIKNPIENIDKLFEGTKYINNIIIKTAIQNIDDNAKTKEFNPFESLEDYSKGGEIRQYFPYLRGQPIKGVLEILKSIISDSNAHSVLIQADNINIDIMGKLMLKFPCKVKLDKNEFPIFSDFETKVKKIYQDHKEGVLKGY
jgi:hypothetical protein